MAAGSADGESGGGVQALPGAVAAELCEQAAAGCANYVRGRAAGPEICRMKENQSKNPA